MKTPTTPATTKKPRTPAKGSPALSQYDKDVHAVSALVKDMGNPEYALRVLGGAVGIHTKVLSICEGVSVGKAKKVVDAGIKEVLGEIEASLRG